ncbi:MAG: DNA adenine methylase [Marinirhabdus sp.]
MNYIGSKLLLSDFIFSTVSNTVGGALGHLVFCDLFAGTGSVGRLFKPHVKKCIANDVEYYSYVLNRNYIGNNRAIAHSPFLRALNGLPPKKGFIFENYAAGGRAGRCYFTAENAQKIDAVRTQIEVWKNEGSISENVYYFLLASLLESADRVANTASVYGAYLKNIKPSAARPLVVKPAVFSTTANHHSVHQEDSNALIHKIQGGILYLDPPYNARQYGANYHLLNTIAKYDTFVPRGKTGLRDYYKSAYCKKGEVLRSFTQLIENAKFKYIFLSYNNEGLMPRQQIEKVMGQFGRYHRVSTKYQRFKADKTENRNHRATETVEFLHILEK